MPNGPTSRILQSQMYAQHVILLFPGYRIFNFLEVQVFDTLGNNNALGALATQSSTNGDYVSCYSASNAVDGIIDGTVDCGGIAASKEETTPWWMVDLGMPFEIDKVVIWNRVNCCTERLSNAAVYLVNENNILVGQVLDIGDTTGIATVELNAADFALPSEMPSVLPSIVRYKSYHFWINIVSHVLTILFNRNNLILAPILVGVSERQPQCQPEHVAFSIPIGLAY